MIISQKPKIFDVDLYGLAGALLLLALAWFLMLAPVQRKRQAQIAHQDTLRQEKQTTLAELARLEQLARRQQSLAHALGQTPDIIAQSKPLPDVLVSFDQVAAHCRISLDDVCPGETLVQQYFNATSLALKLHGSFDGLCQFLQTLRDRMPYIRIASLNLTRDQKGETPTCKIDLTLHIFGPPGTTSPATPNGGPQ